MLLSNGQRRDPPAWDGEPRPITISFFFLAKFLFSISFFFDDILWLFFALSLSYRFVCQYVPADAVALLGPIESGGRQESAMQFIDAARGD